ncbi:MAG: PAS domain S-box protein, partial [Melioribacteraceae bacterium]|nr:PAS domain S-box protein [Melioribacteraceae bacterium]
MKTSNNEEKLLNRITELEKELAKANSKIEALDITERKQIEEAHKESQQKYRLLYDNSPDLILIHDMKEILHINKSGLKLLGATNQDEVVGKPAGDFVHPDDKAIAMGDMKKLFSGEVSKIVIEQRLIQLDGKVINVELIGVPINYGKESMIQIIGRNITERKQAEEELQESESKLLNIFENSTNLFYSHNLDHVVTYLSPQVENILGYSPEEAMIKWTELASENPINEIGFNITVKAIETGKPQPSYELELVHKNGKKVFVEVREAPLVKDGETVSIVGSLTDITERRQAEEVLREKEAMWSALTGNFDGIIQILDTHGTINYMSKVYPPHTIEDVVGKCAFNFMDEASANKARQALKITIAESKTQSFEIDIQLPDGAVVQFDVKYVPKFESYGSVENVISIITDITEHKKTEEVLRLNDIRLEALVTLGQMTTASIKSLSDFALEESIRLTGSTVGYLAYMNEDESVLSMYSWSKTAMANCRIIDKPIEYPIESTGLWGEAVRQRKPIIINDYEAPNPLKKGYPEGHILITRHMNIPLFDGDRIVLVAGVGNKEGEYDQADVRQITLLMEGMWLLTQRKQAEEALQESEERLNLALEVANDGVWDWNITTNEIFFDRRYYTMAGYENNAFPQSFEEWAKRVHPDDIEQSQEQIGLHITGKQAVFDIEFRFKRADENWMWIRGRGGIVERDADGKPMRMIGSHSDITKRKQAEEALKESEQKFRSYIENAPNGIFITDEKGNYLEVNEAAAKITGYSKDE